MRKNYKLTLAAGLLGLGMLAPASAFAQQVPNPPAPAGGAIETPRRPGIRVEVDPAGPRVRVEARGELSANLDQELAGCLLTGLTNEIELARLATTRAQSPAVQKLANRMVAEKTAAWQQLQTIAAPAPAEDEAVVPGRDADQRIVIERPAGPRVVARETRGGHWEKIHKELAVESLASSKRELERYEGKDFDQAFLGMQLANHLNGLNTLRVFSRHASPDFQPLLTVGIAKCTAAKQEIEQLMADLGRADQ